MSHNTWAHRVVTAAVRPLAGTAVTPNHLTTARLVTGLAAAGLFAMGAATWNWVAAIVYVLSMLLDRADGVLARMTSQSSAWGHVYDLICDNVVTALLFVGIGAGLVNSGLGWWAPAMGVLAGLAVTATFWLAAQIDAMLPPGTQAIPGRGGFDPDDTLFIVAPVAWLGWLQPFLILAAVGAPIFATIIFLRYRRLRAGYRVNTSVGSE